MGPEQKRLMDRLFNDPTRKLVNFSVFRGDEPCTREELCAELNSALDQVDRLREIGELKDEPPRTSRKPVDIRYFVSKL